MSPGPGLGKVTRGSSTVELEEETQDNFESPRSVVIQVEPLTNLYGDNIFNK